MLVFVLVVTIIPALSAYLPLPLSEYLLGCAVCITPDEKTIPVGSRDAYEFPLSVENSRSSDSEDVAVVLRVCPAVSPQNFFLFSQQHKELEKRGQVTRSLRTDTFTFIEDGCTFLLRILGTVYARERLDFQVELRFPDGNLTSHFTANVSSAMSERQRGVRKLAEIPVEQGTVRILDQDGNTLFEKTVPAPRQ